MVHAAADALGLDQVREDAAGSKMAMTLVDSHDCTAHATGGRGNAARPAEGDYAVAEWTHQPTSEAVVGEDLHEVALALLGHAQHCQVLAELVGGAEGLVAGAGREQEPRHLVIHIVAGLLRER